MALYIVRSNHRLRDYPLKTKSVLILPEWQETAYNRHERLSLKMTFYCSIKIYIPLFDYFSFKTFSTFKCTQSSSSECPTVDLISGRNFKKVSATVITGGLNQLYRSLN